MRKRERWYGSFFLNRVSKHSPHGFIFLFETFKMPKKYNCENKCDLTKHTIFKINIRPN